MMSNIQIRLRFSDAVIFEAEIAAEHDGKPYGFRLGLAAKLACNAGANLRGADLRGTDLSGVNLSGAYLSGANLSGVYLSGANLSGAHLSGAYLNGAYLSGANLRGADLSGANLRGADLSGADLSGTNLRDVNLSGANLSGAKIISVIARATRIDGYEFIAFRTDKGIIIRAGCRTMSPTEYRSHVAKEYPDGDKASETLAILDYIEARAAQVQT
jgi:uncharacterized protein YjbI with pentapeptide repeats